jgi:hypothetical protein
MNKIAIALGAVVFMGVGYAIAPVAQNMMGGHGMGHGQGMGHNPAHHGSDHGGNHEQHMAMFPMLNGENTTPSEVDDMRALFMRHPDMTRRVENIPNGIRTVTETQNDALRDALVNHVVMMIARIENGDDPRVPIQSPTLSILFEKGSAIETEIIPSDLGVIVVQTSTDPEVVAALQTHAAEVSDLAARGMQSVQDRMMGN